MRVQSWDTAIKAGQQHDASACATFVQREGEHYLLDMQVVRLEYPELKRFVLRHAQQWSADAVLMEDKASGQSLLQDLRRETALPLIGIQPKGDKIARAARASIWLEAGKVALPEFAPWLAAFEQEIAAFPNGKHDDQVDALTQYVCWAMDMAHRPRQNIRRV